MLRAGRLSGTDPPPWLEISKISWLFPGFGQLRTHFDSPVDSGERGLKEVTCLTEDGSTSS